VAENSISHPLQIIIIIIINKNNNNALSFTKDKDISRSQKNFLNEGRTQ
jgi:hypothetical protein